MQVIENENFLGGVQGRESMYIWSKYPAIDVLLSFQILGVFWFVGGIQEIPPIPNACRNTSSGFWGVNPRLWLVKVNE